MLWYEYLTYREVAAVGAPQAQHVPGIQELDLGGREHGEHRVGHAIRSHTGSAIFQHHTVPAYQIGMGAAAAKGPLARDHIAAFSRDGRSFGGNGTAASQ